MKNIIQKVKHYLPEQGPLEFFIHHNTLHSLEEYDFFTAAKKGADLYKAKAFLSISEYKRNYHSGRISPDALNQSVVKFIRENQLEINPALMFELLLTNPNPTTDEIPTTILQAIEPYRKKTTTFIKEWIQQEKGIDIDAIMSPLIFNFLSGYYDFGAAQWAMPEREKGSWYCFREFYLSSSVLANKFEKQLEKVLNEYKTCPPLDIISSFQEKLNLKDADFETYLFELCYRFKGWAATINSLEHNPEWVKRPNIVPSFIDFAAILLVCEDAVTKSVTQKPLPVFPQFSYTSKHSASFLKTFYQLLLKHPAEQHQLLDALPLLTDINREQIWHMAYESTFYNRFTKAYQEGVLKAKAKPSNPRYQVFCCIDDREESFRRYLETDPDCETFGVAGHFNLSILYKSLFSKHHRALSPAAVKPNKQVHEVSDKHVHNYSLITFIGECQYWLFVSSKSLISGFFLTLWYGYASIVPFLIGIFFPSQKAKVNAYFSKKLREATQTTIAYKKEDHPEGFTLPERISIAESLLRNSGFTHTTASYVFIFGHGSSSLNNPHEAAYDCGACGGARGDANARVCAKILNEPEVRKALKERGINIPAHTIFIQGYHNTCNGLVTLFNLPPMTSDLEQVISKVKHASLLDAKERCRRFDDVSPNNSDEFFYHYVQGRSVSLSQARPEYGHATNSLCIVGPRTNTKNLYLDRRSFLVSYDPKVDTDGSILNQLLQAVAPVCAGINLEYYFSCIDNDTYGCGTKLPHNVNSLLGVMNGHMSDLQLGLPRQMIEIHEPVRLLMCIYCSLPQLTELLKQKGNFQILANNHWVELVIHDAETDKIYRYENKTFTEVLPEETSHVPQYHYNDPKFFTYQDHIDFGIIRRDA